MRLRPRAAAVRSTKKPADRRAFLRESKRLRVALELQRETGRAARYPIPRRAGTSPAGVRAAVRSIPSSASQRTFNSWRIAVDRRERLAPSPSRGASVARSRSCSAASASSESQRFRRRTLGM
jgi:hypothetical protein